MIKNILKRIFFIFAFILFSGLYAYSFDDFGVTSVVYDNSSSFLLLNSMEQDDYSFTSKPILSVDSESNTAFIDINSATMRCPTQDYIISGSDIKEINVSQHSLTPNIVRVNITYAKNYNPSNIKLRKLGNTIIINFKNTVSQNYYFQKTYADVAPAVFYESSSIQMPVTIANSSVISQINSAFSFGVPIETDTVLSKKDTVLNTKYFVNELSDVGGYPVIKGTGSYTLGKPLYLSNPSRVAFDIHNSVVNPAIRNKTYTFGDSETIRIGQFDHNTSRVVITTGTPEKYIPILYADSQRIMFADKSYTEKNYSYPAKVNLTSVRYEKTSLKEKSLKLLFSAPYIYGITRSSAGVELYIYNLVDYTSIGIDELKGTPFEKFSISKLQNGVTKLLIPVEKNESIDIFSGNDGKTMRLTKKVSEVKVDEPQQQVSPIISRSSGKKYVVIDPGHGGSDCGATRNNIYEKDITLDLSKRVRDILTKKGYVIYMTRTADETVSLEERVDYSETVCPDVFVSIHVNSSNSETPYGLETHYFKDNSLSLAKYVHASMLNNINSKDRGLFKSRFYVINHTTAPAILVETGFISNPEERAQILTETRKQATAKAIAEGIDDYFNSEK